MPSFFFLLAESIQVGLTAKEVGRLGNSCPNAIEKNGGSQENRLLDFLLEDLKTGKVSSVTSPLPSPPPPPSLGVRIVIIAQMKRSLNAQCSVPTFIETITKTYEVQFYSC